jgi:peptidoglycan/xylan/chitin deacetylase (PgdA/CDA1 family)
LTFDDGPNQFTLINHATLETYKVPATFFFLGNQIKHNESIVKTVSKSGHYVGSHSMTHDKALVYSSTESFIAEMTGAAQLLEQVTGKSANLVRVPYGSKPLVTPSMQKSLIDHGLYMWDWDVDSNDWRYTDKQTSQIIKNVQDGVTKAAKSGDKDIIILLHDRSQTTIALPRIIEWLQKEGCTFKTYEPDNHIIQNFLQDPLL